MKNTPLKICDTTIEPGERVTLALPTPSMFSCARMHVPIHVIHGKYKGPCLVVCGAMHGDEVNSIAIIERFLRGGVVSCSLWHSDCYSCVECLWAFDAIT